VALVQALAQALPQAHTPALASARARPRTTGGQPALLVLDEPTSAQDLHHRQLVVDRLRWVQQQHGTALLVATHDANLIAGLGAPTLPLHPAGLSPID
jgi:energy-coupling factor transporter ATP-binding protein EcfA2